MAIRNLGLVEKIDAEAVGLPGGRTFKITAAGARGTIVVWMEKEQLFEVAVSLKQFVATRESTADPVPFDLDLQPADMFLEIEFKTPQMTLRHDPASDVFTLAAGVPAGDDEEAGGEEEVVEFSFPRPAASRLADTALRVVAAGRPPCPLCTGPLDPGDKHFCVKVNGHSPAGPLLRA